MANVKSPPVLITQLKTALITDLRTAGIDAKVEYTSVPTTKLYRVAVYAPQFKAMKHSERQSLVWRITQMTLSPDEQMRISMILTLTPGEATGI